MRLAPLVTGFLSRNQFVKGVALVAGGTALGQLLAIAVSPILTRLYAPEDFGISASYASILAILLSVSSLRYEMAIPLPEHDDDAADLVRLGSVLTVISSLALATVTLLGRGTVLQAIPFLQPYWWVLPLGLCGAGLYQVLTYWAIRGKAYSVLAQTRISQSAGQIVTQVAFGLFSSGPLGLLLGHIVGQSSGSGTVIAKLWRTTAFSQRGVDFQRVMSAAKRYSRFPKYQVVASLLNTAGVQVPTLLLTTLYGPVAAGFFALSERIIGMPLTVVSNSAAQVFFGQASDLMKSSPEKLPSLMVRTIYRMATLAGVPLIGLAVISPWLFGKVFGGEWVIAGQYVQLLLPALIGKTLMTPVTHIFVILERQDLSLVFNSVRLILAVLSIVLPSGAGLPPKMTILSYSLVAMSSYILAFLMMHRACRTAAIFGGTREV